MEYRPVEYTDGQFGQKQMDVWKGSRADRKELLTPVLYREFPVREFRFIAQCYGRAFLDQLQDLAPWDYMVTFGGTFGKEVLSTADADPKSGWTKAPHKEIVTRFHRYRAELICQTVKDLLGDKFSKSSILDIACNCGVFSLEMAHLGAASVEGFDCRRHNVIQADFLRDAFDLDPIIVGFSTDNILDRYNYGPGYDVVLNLGLMYHLSDPLGALRTTFDACKAFAVVDSICHLEPFAGFHLVTGKETASNVEGDKSYELQPTYRGLLEAMYAVGFKEVVEVVGSEEATIDLYGSGVRRCLIGFKDTKYLDRFRA